MSFDIDGLDEFIRTLNRAANGGLSEQLGLWLEAMGMEFLDVIQDEIIRTGTVDTRRLLNSFGKGDGENMWSISDGGLTLDVGTNVEYASYVNDGHAQSKRFVPGRWDGDRFIHDPGAGTGMMLSAKYVPGTQYWDTALAIVDRMFERSLDRLLQRWLDEQF